MNTKGSVLFLYTKQFPYGNAEQYLVDELPFLALKFEKVVIVPSELFEPEKYTCRAIPSNCEILLLNEVASRSAGKHSYLEFASIFFREWKVCRNKKWFWKERKRYKSVLLHQMHLAAVMERLLLTKYKGCRDVHYAYWIHNSSIMLGVLKRRQVISGFACRGHSIDLYEWDWVLTRYIKILPFYHFIIEQASRVYAISKHGADHLKRRFPELADKFYVSRLGVADNGLNPLQKGIPLLVSCSNFTANKRVDEIAKVVAALKTPVKWLHFGDGKGREQVEAVIKSKSISDRVELRGFVPNEEIRMFYREHTVQMVINLSEAEGIPVSLMEAISFGIPVLATAVNGSPEVANEESGFSVPFDSKTEEIGAIIDQFLANEQIQLQKRRGARELYERSFSCKVNFDTFANELRKLP